ncbi:MAG: nucleotidyltransferase family protein [Patescibacteria group bacterium]
MKRPIQAILLAGGKGTRLAPLTDNCPKPMVPIHGQPMIEYVLDHLKNHGITSVALAIAHMGDQIKNHFGDGSRFGMEISYLEEPEPMGTGGWTQLVDWDALDDNFIVANADNLFWIDIDRFLGRHKEVGGVATIAAIEIPVDKHASYEVLVHDSAKRQLVNYIDRKECESHLKDRDSIFVSSGWYVMTPQIKDLIPKQCPISNEVDVWPLLDKSEHDLGFYHATEPWFDSGTHERLKRVAKFIKENILKSE